MPFRLIVLVITISFAVIFSLGEDYQRKKHKRGALSSVLVVFLLGGILVFVIDHSLEEAKGQAKEWTRFPDGRYNAPVLLEIGKDRVAIIENGHGTVHFCKMPLERDLKAQFQIITGITGTKLATNTNSHRPVSVNVGKIIKVSKNL